MVILPEIVCVCTAHGPALPRDPLCTFSDAHRNHLFAVYVQNNFAACAECYNLFIHVIYNFTLYLYIYMYVLFKTALFNLHPSSEGFYILFVNVTSEHIHLICFT